MPFPITQGYGTDGVNNSNLIVTGGYGSPEPATGFIPVSLTPYSTHIDISFSANIGVLQPTASDPGAWVFSTVGPVPVTVTSIETIGNVLRLNITEPRAGDSYNITVPVSGLVDTGDNPYAGPPVLSFTAVADSPYVAMAQALDARTVRVIYSEPVESSGALTITNYSISPLLRVLAARKETDATYILTVDPQTPGTSYLLTIVNVEDPSQNPV